MGEISITEFCIKRSSTGKEKMNKNIYKGLLYAEKRDYQRAMRFVKAEVKELEREPFQDEKIQAYIIYAELLYKVGVEKKHLVI